LGTLASSLSAAQAKQGLEKASDRYHRGNSPINSSYGFSLRKTVIDELIDLLSILEIGWNDLTHGLHRGIYDVAHVIISAFNRFGSYLNKEVAYNSVVLYLKKQNAGHPRFAINLEEFLQDARGGVGKRRKRPLTPGYVARRRAMKGEHRQF
jgi:hypothetical protein